MDLRPYRHVLAVEDLRRALILGFFIRVPMWASAVLLTLHVVSELDRSYAQAGAVSAASTIAVAVSGPWRGSLLDRIGLRRTVGPALVVQVICWSIAPWVGYTPLIGFAVIAGLFVVPTFSILRQVILRSVPEAQRRTALSLDSAAVELSFMAGPAIGVWMATSWDTRWALFSCQMAAVVAGAVLWIVNPPLRSETPDGETDTDHGVPDPDHDAAVLVTDEPPAARVAWGSRLARWRRRRRGASMMTLPIFVVMLGAAATTVVLTGTDVGVVAALREFQQQSSIGWVLGLWGAGSLVGGLLYGAMHRSLSLFILLGGLSLVTAPVALAVGVPSFAVLLTISGLLCAPTVTATVEALSRLVPENRRGMMMGWHGSAMTTGSAMGAPIAGVAIDRGGWEWGFVVVSAVGLIVAVLAALIIREPRRPVDSSTGAGPSEPLDGVEDTDRAARRDSEPTASAATLEP